MASAEKHQSIKRETLCPISISVLMPAYNEAENIRKVILEHAAVLNSMEGKIKDWELICLDDASTDETYAILTELAATIPQLKPLRNPKNIGITQSFNRLFRSASGTHFYATASDDQWPARNLTNMLEKLLSGFDVVTGVRENRFRVYGLKRELISTFFNLIPKVLFGVATHDAGSVKVGIRDVFLFELVSKSPFAEAERIIKATAFGYRVGFVPITFLERTSGKATGARLKNITDSLRDVIHCLKIYRKK